MSKNLAYSPENQTDWIAAIRKLPKTDIHLHLDGSIRLETIIELAKSQKIHLPSYSPEGLKELVFKSNYKNLEEYLKTFGYSCSVMQTPESLERISFELAQDNQNEGVRYIEIRFAPQLLINQNQNFETILLAVDRGLKKAEQEFNQKKSVQEGIEPPFRYGIIICALRNFGPWSEYYTKLISSFPYSNNTAICAMASLEAAHTAVHLKKNLGLPIVAFDLAGAEANHPASVHERAFQYIHKHFIAKTVHAGEAYGPESIFQAITKLHANRIGHGYFLFEKERIQDPTIRDKEDYVNKLVEFIAAQRITLEVSLTSNLQTLPHIKEVKNHNFGKMLEKKLSVSLCTDNRTVSNTTVTDEWIKAIQGFQMKAKQIRSVVIYGFKRSFFPGSYLEKRNYVRQCLDYYDKIASTYPFLQE